MKNYLKSLFCSVVIELLRDHKDEQNKVPDL